MGFVPLKESLPLYPSQVKDKGDRGTEEELKG